MVNFYYFYFYLHFLGLSLFDMHILYVYFLYFFILCMYRWMMDGWMQGWMDGGVGGYLCMVCGGLGFVCWRLGEYGVVWGQEWIYVNF